MKNYKGVIFDLDGVICHTDQYHYKAWKKIADKLGIYFDEKVNDRLRGVSRLESFRIILENYDGAMSESQMQAYITEKNEQYRLLLREMSPADLDPRIQEMLDLLRCRGKKLAIGSSSKNARFILQRLGILEYFDAISDGNNIEKSKPDPEVFLKAAQFLNLSPACCLVAEDAKAGLLAAKAAGMDCAAIGEAVKSEPAFYHLATASDLADLVK